MKPVLKYSPLNIQQTRELATLISAGIATAKAWEKSSASQHPAGQSILKALRKGTSLAAAFKRFGLVNNPQQIFLAAADDAGYLPSALIRLATEALADPDRAASDVRRRTPDRRNRQAKH